MADKQIGQAPPVQTDRQEFDDEIKGGVDAGFEEPEEAAANLDDKANESQTTRLITKAAQEDNGSDHLIKDQPTIEDKAGQGASAAAAAAAPSDQINQEQQVAIASDKTSPVVENNNEENNEDNQDDGTKAVLTKFLVASEASASNIQPVPPPSTLLGSVQVSPCYFDNCSKQAEFQCKAVLCFCFNQGCERLVCHDHLSKQHTGRKIILCGARQQVCEEHGKKAFICTILTYVALGLLLIVLIAPVMAMGGGGGGGGGGDAVSIPNDCPSEGFRWVEEEYFVTEEYFDDDDDDQL